MKARVCAAVVCLLFAASVRAQSAASAARDLTVRLFSTHTVKSVNIVPVHAMWRLCANCKEQLLSGSLALRQMASGTFVLPDGRSTSSVLLDGELRVAADGGASASAAGHWIVRAEPDGLKVLLTMPSERYVMAVLQSEAGGEQNEEALKALAVVARSFALMHPDRHGIDGLCDSTHCQAARFGRVPDRIHDAVFATAGETLWFGSKRIDGYFMQSCGGRSADAKDVWGGAPKPWLVSHPDNYCQREPALWHANVSPDELRRALEAEGYRIGASVNDVRVVSKDRSGRASKIEIRIGTERLSMSAATFRFAVDRALGWNRLRSDWYSVHVDPHAVLFDGRGYGHGVGLCQAGTAEMAREGKSYREILAFYFQGTQVRVHANDEGWKRFEQQGWTFVATKPDAEFVKDASEALNHARQLWPGAGGVHPFVTIAPNTELFRQMANEPGWALASTRGANVTLQPLPVVRAHGGTGPLMLHEFLHVLVEREASEAAPLWLREGLVEALAVEHGASGSLSPAQSESALRNAGSLYEAQQAHLAAGALVGKLVAKYGLGNVRGWLRSGVPAGVAAGQ